MDAPSPPRLDLSRRAFLGSAAALPLGLGRSRAARPAVATVATWNLSLGIDLFRLFGARSMDDVRRIAGDLLDEVESHPYDARLDAIASAVAGAAPDVVAVQEAALLRTQRPGDFGDSDAEPAETVVADMLDGLVAALADAGASYEVAASTVTTDVELPADGDNGQVDVRITDRVALLARAGAETTDARADTYDATVRVPIPGSRRTLSLRRGYCRADVELPGGPVTAVSTHLESTSAATRQQQASELFGALPDDGPVVLGGDFNSGPGTTTGAYDVLAGTYDDAFAVSRPDDDGYTCCQAPTLENDESRLDSRVDAVLYRGDLRPFAVERLGADPADRVDAEVDGEPVALWPSDHAGVVATFERPRPTAAPTPTPSATPRPTPGATDTQTPMPTRRSTRTDPSTSSPADPETASESGPGFGVLAALSALGLGALARKNDD